MSSTTAADAALTAALERTARLIETANLPEDVRAVAFGSILERILGALGTSAGSLPGIFKGEAGGDGSAIARLALKLGVPPEAVEDVYQPNPDGYLDVHVPTAKLSKTKSAATKELALLFMAGRQLDFEEWTESDAIIPVLEHYGKFDSANNATIMKDDKYWKVSGSGKKRKFQLRKTGWEAGGDLIKTIAG